MVFERELLVATHAVRKASFLTKRVQQSIIQHRDETTITKPDSSPVTLGDYAAQTIIINAIKSNFPNDFIVGEESADGLNDEFLSSILNVINDIDQIYKDNNVNMGSVDFTNENFPLKTIDDVRQIINFGDYQGGSKGRFWCLDPIDGTKGFLRGEQFAVCLALIVDGEVQCGVIGCPNLKLSQYDPMKDQLKDVDESFGYIFRAVRGQGASFTDSITLSNWKDTHVRHLQDTKDMIALEGVEKSHSSHEEQGLIKKRLGITKSIHIDSQAKYCLLAMGLADVYLRLPIKMSFQEKIWDHAAGNAIVLESGGFHTDALENKNLDFSKGRTLLTKGVIATCGPAKLHELVVSISKEVLSSRK